MEKNGIMDNRQRTEAFEKRLKHLKKMSDQELKDRFWELCAQVVEPVAELARTHTSPSIERSVLLRMGIDSVSTHAIVTRIHEAGLLGKGAGNIVLKTAEKKGCGIREAGQLIIDDGSILDSMHTGGAAGGIHAGNLSKGAEA